MGLHRPMTVRDRTKRPEFRGLMLPGLLCAGLAGAWGCTPADEVPDPVPPSSTPAPPHSEPSPTSDTVLVADGRGEGRAPEANPAGAPSTWETHPGVLAAASASRLHWTREEPGWEEEFRVMDHARGAFTRPGADQDVLLYLMALWPRCCPKMGMVVLEAGTPVRNLAFVGVAQTLRGLPDLDGDGLDELVLEGSFGMGGQTSTTATVLSFTSAGVLERGPMGILDSACATGRPEAGSEAARITALPGPVFHVVRYSAACDDGAEWTPQGDLDRESLEPQPVEGWVVLDPPG